MNKYEGCYHDASRLKVCGCCFRKDQQLRTITDSILDLIKEFCFSDYSLDDTHLPKVVCTGCLRILKGFKDGDDKRRLPSYDYQGINKPKKVTRSISDDPCDCTLCCISRMNGLQYKMYCKSQKNKPGRPKSVTPEVSLPAQKLCSDCHSEIHKGRSHVCTEENTKNNFVNLIKKNSLI